MCTGAGSRAACSQLTWAQVGLASYLGAGRDVFSFLEGHGAEGIHLVSLTGILEPGPI